MIALLPVSPTAVISGLSKESGNSRAEEAAAIAATKKNKQCPPVAIVHATRWARMCVTYSHFYGTCNVQKG